MRHALAMPPLSVRTGSLPKLGSASDIWPLKCCVSPEWRYVAMNPPLAEYLGHTTETLVGRVIWDLFPGIEHSAFGHALKRVMQNRQRYFVVAPSFVRPEMKLVTRIEPCHRGGLLVYCRAVLRLLPFAFAVPL